MKTRDLKKRARRLLKTERRQLVHAAGCVFTECCLNWVRNEDFSRDYPFAPGVRVPRSLRVFGFRVAP